MSKENAEGVALHLLALTESLEAEDMERALAHALTATRRAGRVAVVREMLGIVYYRQSEWSKALSEFRTARRLSGSHHLLPLIADAERGLGRPEKAIELGHGPEVETLKKAERVELAIVISGARQDVGQSEAGVHSLRDVVGRTQDSDPWAARLYYAYAEALAAAGKKETSREWLATAAKLDTSGETDARVRVGARGAGPREGDIANMNDLQEEN